METKQKEIKKEAEPVKAKKVRIRIIGVGGGGSNIIAELSRKLKDFSSQKVDFVAVNTDNQALKNLPTTVKSFPFGSNITKGLGTGRNPEIGEKAAKEDIERIKNLFAGDRDLYIFVSSLGGGTGTGATPVLVKIAEEMGLGNAVIQIGEKINIDQFIDALSRARTYLPMVAVVTKIDENKKLKKEEGVIYMSAVKGIGIEEFKEKVWEGLGLVRVYLKRERSGQADKKKPLIMKSGKNLDDVLKRVSKEMRDDVSRACIWGKKARFPGQEVSCNFEVFDEMEVWFGR